MIVIISFQLRLMNILAASNASTGKIFDSMFCSFLEAFEDDGELGELNYLNLRQILLDM